MISSFGDVKSLSRCVKTGRGGIVRLPEKILAKTKRKGGYLEVGLSVLGKISPKFIHKLVAESFIENPENKKQVNHINGVKTDNRLANLEWVTPAENQNHAIRTGLVRVRLGEEKGDRAKLKNNQVVEIKKLLRDKIATQTKIASMFGVSRSTIGFINTGETWSHIKI